MANNDDKRAIFTQVQVLLDAFALLLLSILQFLSVIALLWVGVLGLWMVGEGGVQFWCEREVIFCRDKDSQGGVAGASNLPTKSGPANGDKNSQISSVAAANVPRESEPTDVDGNDHPMYTTFQGLEYLLMAPLFFLLARSISQYVVDLRMKEMRHSTKGIKSSEQAPDGSISKIANKTGLGKESLRDTKTLAMGLLFAIIATHLVGRLISGEYSKAGAISAKWFEVTVGGGLLVLLGAAYLYMESPSHNKSGGNDNSSSDAPG